MHCSRRTQHLSKRKSTQVRPSSRDSGPLQPPVFLPAPPPPPFPPGRLHLSDVPKAPFHGELERHHPLVAIYARAGATFRRRKSGTRDQVTVLARWRGSLEVLRHSTGWRRHLRSQVLSVSPRGTSRVRRCIQARRSERFGPLGGERGACCAWTVARKGQATRAARTDLSTIFHRVVKLGSWVSEENGRVPGPSEGTWGTWASHASAGLLPALPRQRDLSPAGGRAEEAAAASPRSGPWSPASLRAALGECSQPP